MKMDAGFLQKAQTALSVGVTIADSDNDFADMGKKDNTKEKPNNPESYKFSFLDIKNVSFGMDEDYLYCKTQFSGTIPGRPPKVENDRIKNYGVKLNLVSQKGVDQIVLHFAYDFLTPFSSTFQSCFYSSEPTGIKEPEDAQFARRDEDCKVLGGAGTDYLLVALPIKKLNITFGQELFLAVSGEAESAVYDHASVDVLGGYWKMPAVITWKAGTQEFKVDNEFYQSNWENLK